MELKSVRAIVNDFKSLFGSNYNAAWKSMWVKDWTFMITPKRLAVVYLSLEAQTETEVSVLTHENISKIRQKFKWYWQSSSPHPCLISEKTERSPNQIQRKHLVMDAYSSPRANNKCVGTFEVTCSPCMRDYTSFTVSLFPSVLGERLACKSRKWNHYSLKWVLQTSCFTTRDIVESYLHNNLNESLEGGIQDSA